MFLQNAMAKFGKSLHVLATEEGFDDTVRMTDDKVLMLADTMRANFDMAILDLPRHFVMREPALFSRFDDIVIVAELTLQSLRDANRLTRLMQARNRRPKLHIVANQVPAKPDVTVKEFEAGIEAKLRCVFPHDPKAMARAALKGQPLVDSDPKHRIVADLHRLCIELAGVPEEAKTGLLQAPQAQESSAAWMTGFDAGRHRRRPRSLSMLRSAATERLRQALGADGPRQGEPARDSPKRANEMLEELVAATDAKPTLAEQRQLLRDIVDAVPRRARAPRLPAAAAAAPAADPLGTTRSPRSRPRARPSCKNKRELQVKAQVMPLLMQRIDISVASSLGPDELRMQIAEIVEEIIVDLRIQLNAAEMRSIVRLLVDDMVGLGPLEPLLADETVTDIMVNGASQVYVERKGKLELTDVQFRDDAACDPRRHPHRHRGRPARRRNRRRWSTPASRTAAASTSSSRRSPSTGRPSPSASSPRRRSPST